MLCKLPNCYKLPLEFGPKNAVDEIVVSRGGFVFRS